MRPCLTSGCPALVVKGRCPKHEAGQRQLRRARYPWRWVYDDARWRGPNGARLRALARAKFRCEYSPDRDNVRCSFVDKSGSRLHGHHLYEGGLSQLIADGADPFDDDLVMCVCEQHHQQLEFAERRWRESQR